MRFASRTVVVTGGSQGIGEGCVRAFVGEGGSAIIASPDRPRGEGLARELTEAGPGRARFIVCDVTREDDRTRLVAETVAADGRIDCLVNNAGWHPPHKPIDEFSLDDFRRLFELNVVSVFALCQLALPHLRRTRGSIINVASLVATIGQHYATTYVATKGAVLAFTKALAIDEAPHGVRVNAISPGNIMTPLWQGTIDAATDPEACRAAGDAAQVVGRMGTPAEVGRLCLFLAAEATFTTGVDHVISGGAEIGYGRKA